jgi:hypothetical protein
MTDKPTQLYTLQWTQPYDHFNGLNDKEIATALIDALIDNGSLADAQEVLQRIMKL